MEFLQTVTSKRDNKLAINLDNALKNLAEEGNVEMPSINIKNRATMLKNKAVEKMKLKESIEKTLLTNVVYNIVNESLLLDKDFKEQHAGNIFGLVKETVNNLMETGKLTKDFIKNESSQYVQEVMALAEEIASEKASLEKDDKYSKEEADLSKDKDGQEVLNEKRKKESNVAKKLSELDDLSKDPSVVDTIKEKVVNVINTERTISEIQKDKDELYNTAKEQNADDTAISATNQMVDDTGDETATEDKDAEDTEVAQESFRFDYRLHKIPNKLQTFSLFKSLQFKVMNEAVEHAKSVMVSEGMEFGDDISVNMDYVLAETITMYTLLETLNTIKLVNYTPKQLRELANQCVYKK